MVDLQFMVSTEHELKKSAAQAISASKNPAIWAFSGEMGVGKTTFIKAICAELGVNSEMSSPTFSIVNEYVTSSGEELYHFDLYRVKNTEELFDFGFEDYLYSGKHCFIEWYEIAQHLLPHGYLEVKMGMQASQRKISISTINEKN